LTFIKPVSYKQPKRDYLTIDEIKLIEAATMPDGLSAIRDYFLLACYTGLRYSDLKKFDAKKSVVKNPVERIIIGTTKTGEVVSIKISEKVKSIIERINKPIISNFQANKQLKLVGAAAGIPRPLTMHMARHSALQSTAHHSVYRLKLFRNC
jgi:integrase